MLFPIIRVLDLDNEEHEHIVGTNTHDMLVVDEDSGELEYYNLQCGEGTKKYHGHSSFRFAGVPSHLGTVVEFVSFEKLCELYRQQTDEDAKRDKLIRELFSQIESEK